MKEFDFNLAKAGLPVQTRDGRKARIICWDCKGELPIVALIEYKDKDDEDVGFFATNGRLGFNVSTSDYDLVMAPVIREGWINVYEDRSVSNYYYDDKETAMRMADDNVVATVKIAWEE